MHTFLKTFKKIQTRETFSSEKSGEILLIFPIPTLHHKLPQILVTGFKDLEFWKKKYRIPKKIKMCSCFLVDFGASDSGV